MARKKTLTPEQKKLNRQFYEQRTRIERNYNQIKALGGSFSQSVEEIIKKPKKIEPSTIRRLKKITIEDMYRMATVRSTGESGWKLRTKRLKEAQRRSYRTREIKQKLKNDLGFADWELDLHKAYKDYRRYTESDYKLDFNEWKEDYYQSRLEEVYKQAWDEKVREQEWNDRVDFTPEEPLPEISYEETVPEPSEEPLPETSYEEPDYGYVPDFSSETESTEGYDTKVEENIETILNDNQDTTFAKAIKNEFDKMKNNMSESEFQEWLKKNGQKFLDTVEEVVKYEPKASHTGEGLNKFTQSMTMLNDGITPLDKFSAGNDAYYAPPDQYMEDYYEDYEEEEEDDSDLYVDRATGEIERLHKETYRQRIDKWGREHYNTEWFDENGLTVNISNYIPISQVKENEDYY